MTADEIMTEHVTTIDETATLAQAVEVMEERGIRHLPVVRGRELVGMLSDRDLRGYGVSMVNDVETLERLQARLGEPVSNAMSADVIRVGPATDIPDVVDLLLEEHIHAVPVVDDDTDILIGIVSADDVLRAMRAKLAD
jgi:CBS domain-containing protein